jgi:superfamily I DNA/RNA helicase
METERVWSVYQQAGIKDAQEGTGHTVIVARAGSGKSTLQEEMICHIPQGLRTLVCAFNVEIKDAFKERESRIRARRPDMGERDLEIKTVCGLGFAVCRYAFKGVKVDEFKAYDQALELVPGDEFKAYRSMLVKVAGLAKGFLVNNPRDAFLICAKRGDTELALVRIGVDPEKATEKDEQRAIEQMANDMLALMDKARSDTLRVDFDDMWWLPVVLNLRGWGYDRIFCDEAQDLSYCQFKLLQKMTKRNGRICMVLDPMQVIYEFRGGTATMHEVIAEELRAKVLPLSITYRCDKSIVDVAKEIVDDFEARPGAPDGIVQEVGTKEYAAVYDLAKPGDFVISRKNAPLLSLCIGFLKRGTPAIIRGRKDVAQVLLSLIERSRAKTLDKLNEWVDKWESREIKRTTRKNPEADTSNISDTAEAIRVLASDVESVSEIRAKIEVLFTDGDDARRIVLTSTHRAKGLERDRCIVLADTYRRGGEESRLWYVAVTRAKHELYLVRNEKEDARKNRRQLAQSAEQ